MTNKQLAIIAILTLIGLLLWQQWRQQQMPSNATPTPTTQTKEWNSSSPGLLVDQTDQTTQSVVSPKFLVTLEDEWLRVVINAQQGQVVSMGFKKQLDFKTQQPYQIVRPNYVQMHDQLEGLKKLLPKKSSWIISEKTPNYLVLTQETQAANAPMVQKIFSLNDEKNYQVRVTYRIKNRSDRSIRAGVKAELRYPQNPDLDGTTQYFYAANYQNSTYKKISSDDSDEQIFKNQFSKGGYIAAFEKHFIAAIIPDTQLENHYFGYQENQSALGIISPKNGIEIAPHETKVLSFTLLSAPKFKKLLAQFEKLDNTIDYGILGVLGRPVFWLLHTIYDWVQNWGIAIIILTFLIKLLFYKPSSISYRSIAKMRALQPRIIRIKETCGDDKMLSGKKVMELYRTEKVNPLGGCLPIVLQIPVFIVLYWVLLESVELRMASFLWINDLSSQDPFYILPILMGVSMFIQQRITPKPTDPIQAKVMMMLPLIFTVFFVFFPAGLVLYWVTNNTVSILHQWFINKQIDKKNNAH